MEDLLALIHWCTFSHVSMSCHPGIASDNSLIIFFLRAEQNLFNFNIRLEFSEEQIEEKDREESKTKENQGEERDALQVFEVFIDRDPEGIFHRVFSSSFKSSEDVSNENHCDLRRERHFLFWRRDAHTYE